MSHSALAGRPAAATSERRPLPTLLALGILPLLLLGLVIGIFVTTEAGLNLALPAPVEDVLIERFVLEPGFITAHLRNNSPQPVTIAQVLINDSVWPATAHPDPTIPRLGTAEIVLQYPWVEAEAYHLVFMTENAIAFEGEIPVAFATPQPDGGLLVSFTLIGLYVGVIPVALGLLWFPALRRLGSGAMTFLLAATAGLLVVLGIESAAESLEQAALVPGPFQGLGLVGIGTLLAFLLLSAVGARQRDVERDAASGRLRLAFLIALGIGLHNLGEGLSIGAAYALGEVALGRFLVIGFIVQNITEGIGILSPILRERPGLGRLALLGVLAGVPTIFGTWIGGFTYSAVAATLFLAIGTGAILQVAWEIGRLLLREHRRAPAPLLTFSGVAAGMLVLYGTGILLK